MAYQQKNWPIKIICDTVLGDLDVSKLCRVKANLLQWNKKTQTKCRCLNQLSASLFILYPGINVISASCNILEQIL